MGGALECGVNGLSVLSEHNRQSPSAFWDEMHRLADEQYLLALARLEFLQERLFRAIEQQHESAHYGGSILRVSCLDWV